MENDDENENENIKMLIEILKINEQLESTFEYLIPHVKDISTRSINSTLSQKIKTDIQSFRFMMNDRFITFQNFKREIENNLMMLCDHNWIIDYIDNTEYESRQIIYCEKCELTKRK